MSGDTMTADVAREALSALDATGACGAPTLRSALTTVIALDAAVRAMLGADVDADRAAEEHREVCDSAETTPDQVRAASDALWRATTAAVRARVALASLLGR